jgi:hypothetical protein
VGVGEIWCEFFSQLKCEGCLAYASLAMKRGDRNSAGGYGAEQVFEFFLATGEVRGRWGKLVERAEHGGRGFDDVLISAYGVAAEVCVAAADAYSDLWWGLVVFRAHGDTPLFALNFVIHYATLRAVSGFVGINWALSNGWPAYATSLASPGCE